MGRIQEPVKKAESQANYGSDVIAELLRQLDFKYVALNPGSSYRGLHDSLVNHNGNQNPRMLVCLHEEHAIALAHGWAKVTEKPMLCILHANVGIQHASMAIYNGALGPWDADKRRPWIDWIHTSTDQAALVRQFVKWDDQPASVPAALNSILRANHMAATKPFGPTYVPLDLTFQEDAIEPGSIPIPDISRFKPGHRVGPSTQDVQAVTVLLATAKKPLFMFGRMGRSVKHWEERVAFIEKVQACVITDGKQAAAFPYPHRCQPSAPSSFLPEDGCNALQQADLIIALDWTDLAGTFRIAFKNQVSTPTAKVINVSQDSGLANGWSKDTGAFAATDLHIPCDPDLFMSSVAEAYAGHPSTNGHFSGSEVWPPQPTPEEVWTTLGDTPFILQSQFTVALYAALDKYPATLIRHNLGFNTSQFRFDHPLSSLGDDGGAGISSGPGMTVGAALALREMAEAGGEARLPYAILGDGDFLMGNSAIWTAACYEIPLLIVIANNASFFNDEVHQERIAKIRGRPEENKWIGQRIGDPEPNLSKLAESFGLTTPGAQITDPSKLQSTLEWAVDQVRNGHKTVLVDVKVRSDAYKAAPA